MGSYSEYQDREPRGPDGIANKIISTRNYPGNECLSFLIVEGTTDENTYRTLVDKSKCRINVAFSKSTAIQVLMILEQSNLTGIIAIVDADFDVLDGKSLVSQNILFTDTHDLETMIMRSPALEKMLGEFGSAEKIDRITQTTEKDICTILFECCLPIGYLRWISLREKLSLKFEGLDFTQFIEEKTLTINQYRFIQVVKNKSQRHDIADAQLETSLRDLKKDLHDQWYVCCGHDLVHVLSLGLRKAIGSWNTNDVKPEVVERSLRLAFDLTHFKKTLLYASILQWEKANEPFVVLASE